VVDEMVALKWILYTITFIGLCGLVAPAFQPYRRRTQQRITVVANLGKQKTASYSWFKHLDRMLYLANPRYEAQTSVYRFLAYCLLLGAATFWSVYFFTSELPFRLTTSNPFLEDSNQIRNVRLGLGFALFVSLLAACFPYAGLRVRYLKRKVQGGYDLLDVVKTLSRFSHLSLDSALSRTADTLSDGNALKKPLKLLVFTVSGYTFESELRHEADRFVQAIGTTFAVAFISNILLVHRSGGNLRETLLQLTEEMEQQMVSVLSARKDVSDAISMGSWGNLLIVLSMCGGMAFVLGWPVYTRLQFQTVSGVVFFTTILVTTIASFAVSLFLSRPRLDYK
jgi:hypothetical protein